MPQTTSLAKGDPLAAIPGLDAADGLGRVLGQRKAYLDLLRTFASGQGGAPDAIRAALASGRKPDAERAAHTLKGVAGSIGARELQAEAAEVEAALGRDAPPSEVLALLDRAAARLDVLLEALAATVPPEVETLASGPVDPVALRVSIERIERLLEQDDAEAVDALDAAAPLLATALGERAAAVRKLVKDYRFKEALDALREAAGHLPDTPPTS